MKKDKQDIKYRVGTNRFGDDYVNVEIKILSGPFKGKSVFNSFPATDEALKELGESR